MIRNMEPKTTNFNFSGMHGDKTVNLGECCGYDKLLDGPRK